MIVKALQTVAAAVSSRRFFVVILVLFVLQASWIAVSVAYPQPFDENTHFALIKIYSHQLSPFLAGQPAGADALGAVARDPSYLYHYLLSFPYRIFAHFFHSLPAQIIFLRFINISIFAMGIVAFRKLLLFTKASPGIVNTTLLFFIFIPVVPFLAGQLNYDNLLMLVTPIVLLLSLKFVEQLERHKRINYELLFLTVSIGLLGCLVKFEFLPIFASVVGYLIFKIVRTKNLNLMAGLKHKLLSKDRWRGTLLAVLLLLSFGLFFQRYGVNYINYGSPLPSCDKVLTINQCSKNSPWKRSYDARHKSKNVNKNPVRYSASWVVRMFIYSFYVRSGGADKHAYYKNINPLPLIAATAIIVFGAGVGLFIYFAKEILRQHKPLVFLLFVSAVYCIVLWLDLYHGYLKTGEKFAINGRYLFPVILPIMLAIGLAYQRLLRKRQLLKPALLIVVFILFLQGGGILTFIVGSNRYWYWHNQFIYNLNQDAQKIAKPLIVE